jgi:hypothetical protein
VTSVRQRPAHRIDARPYPSRPRYEVICPAASCDEVLAARLAEGLLRVQWLGATIERLFRRLAGRPAADASPAVGGPSRPGSTAGE